MRTTIIVATSLLWVCGAVSPASAQQELSLEFKDGRVRLIADNVPVSEILAEWSRRGGTRIVNGERVPGPPVTLQLLDVPERQALDVVLRGAAGYMVSARETTAPDTSAFEKVLVMPTTARAPAASALPQPAPTPTPTPTPQPQFQLPETDEPAAIEEPEPEPEQEPQGIRGVPGFQRGRAPVGLNLPTTAPANAPQEDPAEDPETAAPAPAPGNPFGIPPGSTRPGVINKPPEPDPDTPQRNR